MEDHLSSDQVQDLRALERTLDGAYWRTSVGLLGASLVTLRLFDRELRYLAVIFILFATGMFLVDHFRRKSLKRCQFNPTDALQNDQPGCTHPNHPPLNKFYSPGNFVAMAGGLAITAYLAVIGVLWGSR